MSIANNHILHNLKVTLFQAWYHRKTIIKPQVLLYIYDLEITRKFLNTSYCSELEASKKIPSNVLPKVL